MPDKDICEDVSNLMSVADLKKLFLDKLGSKSAGLDAKKLRFFCLGKELQDDLYVYSYNLMDDITIQCMVRNG